MRPPLHTLQSAAALVTAAVCGAAARWAILAALPSAAPLGWPLIAVNGIGCAVIGWAAPRIVREVPVTAVTLGWCGAFTSASSFALEVAVRLEEGATGGAVAHVVLTVTAAATGFAAGRRLALLRSR